MKAPLREEAQLSVVVRHWASPSLSLFVDLVVVNLSFPCPLSFSPFLLFSAPQQRLSAFEAEVEALVCTSVLARDKEMWLKTNKPPPGLNVLHTHAYSKEVFENIAARGHGICPLVCGIDIINSDLASPLDLALPFPTCLFALHALLCPAPCRVLPILH